MPNSSLKHGLPIPRVSGGGVKEDRLTKSCSGLKWFHSTISTSAFKFQVLIADYNTINNNNNKVNNKAVSTTTKQCQQQSSVNNNNNNNEANNNKEQQNVIRTGGRGKKKED